MSETTKIDMIIIMRRLKRLIGSSYHQKRIDIIIIDNAHYVRNNGTWASSQLFDSSDTSLGVIYGPTEIVPW